MNQLCCCCCSLKLCLTLCDPTDCSPRAPVSIRFSRQEHRSRLPFPSPGTLPALGIEPTSSVLQADSLPSEPPGKQINHTSILKKKKKKFFQKKWIVWIITGTRFKSMCVPLLPAAIWTRHSRLPSKHYFIRRGKDHSSSDSPKAWGATWDGISHTPLQSEDLPHELGKQLCLQLHQPLQLPLDLVFQLWVLSGVCVCVCVCSFMEKVSDFNPRSLVSSKPEEVGWSL